MRADRWRPHPDRMMCATASRRSVDPSEGRTPTIVRAENMSTTEVDVLGPVDYLVIEFPEGKQNFKGEGMDELKSLVERGIVRMLDMIIISRNADGSVD